MNPASLIGSAHGNNINLVAGLLCAFMLLSIFSEDLSGGILSFDGKTNIGRVRIPGSVRFDSADGTLRMTGSGENIWGTEDAFYFVWKKVEGDLSCSTALAWEEVGKHPHRKAGWMIRAGLETDDPYVDAVMHGDGLISMQYRKTKGDITYEVQFPVRAHVPLQLDRTGSQFTLRVFGDDGTIHPVATITVELPEAAYAGLVVCSHDSTVEEAAIFSKTRFAALGVIPPEKRIIESTLDIVDVKTGVQTVVRCAKEHFEAPNWSRDGKTFVYNAQGCLFILPVEGGEPQRLNTGFANKCNNDHGISWSGKELAISHHGKDGKSLIYRIPVTGGDPQLVTAMGPSYWHGWSPDDKTMAYCAERNGEFDVYTISADGGAEKRLTTTPGLDDGPEFSPDGIFIYFNSMRSGQMKIWRMRTDGSEQVQITPPDEYNDWFAHVSPDNKWIVFVSYEKNVEGHPPNKNVVLRLMSTAGGEIRILARLLGGQGTINVPSWSPDSRRVAFVSYRLVIP